MIIAPRPIVQWHQPGGRIVSRVAVTGRTPRCMVRVIRLTDGGLRIDPRPRLAHAFELRLRNAHLFADPVDTLNRLLAAAPFVGAGDDHGPPMQPGCRIENVPGTLFA